MSTWAPVLIVIRGNSGSGKTTLASQLQRELGRGTANVGQDYLRRVVLREHDAPGGDNIGLIASTTRYCLGIGYHVILEGILLADHYGPMLRELLSEHRGPQHVFYVDVSLAETLRRHEERPMRSEVAPDRLREWFVPRDLLGVTDEVEIRADCMTSGAGRDARADRPGLLKGAERRGQIPLTRVRDRSCRGACPGGPGVFVPWGADCARAILGL